MCRSGSSVARLCHLGLSCRTELKMAAQLRFWQLQQAASDCDSWLLPAKPLILLRALRASPAACLYHLCRAYASCSAQKCLSQQPIMSLTVHARSICLW